MNKQQEALKLALEALKAFHYAMIDAGVLDRQEVLNQGFTAFTTIREALAEQPAQQPVAMRYDFDGYGYKYIDAGSGSDWQTRIKDAEPVYTSPQPAQQQKPVAALQRVMARLADLLDEDQFAEIEGIVVSAGVAPPASKPWVGLTDEEMKARTQSPFVVENYRAIEAKLREKNT